MPKEYHRMTDTLVKDPEMPTMNISFLLSNTDVQFFMRRPKIWFAHRSRGKNLSRHSNLKTLSPKLGAVDTFLQQISAAYVNAKHIFGVECRSPLLLYVSVVIQNRYTPLPAKLLQQRQYSNAEALRI